MSAIARARALFDGRVGFPGQSDAVGVALFPDRLVIARVGGIWRRRVKHKDIVGLAPAAGGAPAWQAPLEELARRVMDGALAGANVTLVLSSHFVHYVLVPWSELLQREEDQLAYARQRLLSVHGSAAEGWSLRLSRAGPRRPRLACGVPGELVAGLNDAMAPLGERYRSLQPHLMASFNRWSPRFGAQPCWFVAAEPGLACLALLQDGEWQSVHAFKLDGAWPAQLPSVLARERYLVDGPTECDRVSVYAPDLPPIEATEAGGWKIENLRPALPPGLAAGVDAAFAIVVGS